MKVDKLEFKENELDSFGLKSFSTSSIDETIALVGKNGSGKTRCLKAINNKIKNYTLPDLVDGALVHLPSSLTKIKDRYQGYSEVFRTYDALEKAQNDIKENPNSKELLKKISNLRTHYNHLNRTVNKMINPKDYQTLNNIIKNEIQKRVKYVKNEDFRALRDSIDFNEKKVTFQNIIDSTTDNIDVDEFSAISTTALNYLKKLPNRLAFDDLDTKGDDKKFKNRVSYKRFQLLSRFINEFLGKELNWKRENSEVTDEIEYINIRTKGSWTLNDREFNYAEFSDGEKVLFTYALLLFLLNTNPRIKFEESIIIIDEPELNLHPKAQVNLISTLQELVKDKGQLIIATHSIPIISSLSYSSIYLVKDSQLFYPKSSRPHETVEELMGFDEHFNKIVEFLISTPSWAMTNFMAQCFEDPEVFESAGQGDPQIEVFKQLLLNGENLKILDYGAGKGRLLDKIKESESNWRRLYSYDCFDINKDYNDLVLNKGATNVINNLNELEESKYDVIAIVNVLHEIPVQDWVQSINKIAKSLKPEGFLALIEDVELPIGELPNENGFLILDKKEMGILFEDKVSFISPSNIKYKDRIVCGIVKGEDFSRINRKKLIRVFEELKKNSLNDIRKYRKAKSQEARLGRLYALKANLYVNSDLAINHLKIV